MEAWPDRGLDVTGASNEETAACDLVVVATPWDGAVPTVRPLADALAGKVVVSMANALAKEGREFLALVPPRGSVAASVQAAAARVVGVGGLPSPPGLGDGEARRTAPGRRAGLLGPSGGHRGDASALVTGSTGSAAWTPGASRRPRPIEAFTAVLITVNIRHQVHSTVRLAGYGDA